LGLQEGKPMAGYILLEGGAEFGGKMALPDQRAIELAGGLHVPVSIIPTAAAPDHNHERAGRNGVKWFGSLGATQVESLPLIDKSSAANVELARKLARSRLIYLLGGFTGYLGDTLKDSLAWQACLEAYAGGAVIAGSSAGAMVLCQFYYDPQKQKVVEGLALVPNTCVLPHHDTFGHKWVAQLTEKLPNAVLLGIDERTGMLNDGTTNTVEKKAWRVYGQGEVVLYRKGQPTAYGAGSTFADAFI
jgi:cyanophycinase